ncbi:hypothetical protein BV326_05564 [Pseudomonas syringae pv. actinidiae]|nr:hypothetical protein BV326_05564 [Pseudomonas syringae pv. actinidiae]OSR65250.1 hypothetical protein BV327_05451 [Pseudomonas syringae pv. actinidiae]
MIITRYDTHPIPYGVADQVIQLVTDNVTELSLMHRNFKMPMHQADAMKEASCLHSDA